MTRKTILAIVALAIVSGSVYAYYALRTPAPRFNVTTAAATVGDVVDTVGATGTLQAVTTVQVGTQVSGTIQSLNADFNSLVRKGQVLARLDPSLFETQIEQARANLIRSEADLERLRVTLEDAQTKLTRARELAGRQLLPKSELDSAEVAVRAAQAQLRSQEAQVTQARASLRQNEVNLQHTVIEAPIDGLVISRSVDVGQTVAASMQAPTLFLLAADLTKMQVVANLDESDVGRIRPRQAVTFRVDAYPADTFTGLVSQVRLEPKVQQNVVTYATVIDVPNDALKLKPGMTANVNIEIARSSNVLRVPNGALRFRPTSEIYAALGQPPPDPATLTGYGGRAGVALDAGEPASVPARSGQPGQSRGGVAPPGLQGPGESGRGTGPRLSGRGDLAERLQNMPPEQRERLRERRRSNGLDVRDREDVAQALTRRRRGNGRTTDRPTETLKNDDSPQTIDALFGPLPRSESPGRVWIYTSNQLTPVRLRLGITDGQMTEVLEGDLTPGQELVTSVTTGSTSTRPAATGGFPFGQPGGRAGNFGSGGNRGNGRGR